MLYHDNHLQASSHHDPICNFSSPSWQSFLHLQLPSSKTCDINSQRASESCRASDKWHWLGWLQYLQGWADHMRLRYLVVCWVWALIYTLPILEGSVCDPISLRNRDEFWPNPSQLFSWFSGNAWRKTVGVLPAAPRLDATIVANMITSVNPQGVYFGIFWPWWIWNGETGPLWSLCQLDWSQTLLCDPKWGAESENPQSWYDWCWFTPHHSRIRQGKHYEAGGIQAAWTRNLLYWNWLQAREQSRGSSKRNAAEAACAMAASPNWKKARVCEGAERGGEKNKDLSFITNWVMYLMMWLVSITYYFD